MLAVSKCVFSAVDSIVSLRASALAFSMILALPSTGDTCREGLSGVVNSMITVTEKDLRVIAPRGQASGDDLMRVLPSLHVCLSSFEALLRASPKILRTEDAWEKLDLTASHLAKNYNLVYQCFYTDSNGRDTKSYLDVISKLICGFEVPPREVRRQTLTLSPDVVPVRVQEPVGSPKPPSKARVHWPSWLRISSFHDQAGSGSDLRLEHLV